MSKSINTKNLIHKNHLKITFELLMFSHTKSTLTQNINRPHKTTKISNHQTYLKTSLAIALVTLYVATTATTTFIVDSDLTRAKDH
jgi:hypothetical protein